MDRRRRLALIALFAVGTLGMIVPPPESEAATQAPAAVASVAGNASPGDQPGTLSDAVILPTS